MNLYVIGYRIDNTRNFFTFNKFFMIVKEQMGNIEAVLKAVEIVNILWIGNYFLKVTVGGEGRAEN